MGNITEIQPTSALPTEMVFVFFQGNRSRNEEFNGSGFYEEVKHWYEVMIGDPIWAEANTIAPLFADCFEMGLMWPKASLDSLETLLQFGLPHLYLAVMPGGRHRTRIIPGRNYGNYYKEWSTPPGGWPSIPGPGYVPPKIRRIVDKD